MVFSSRCRKHGPLACVVVDAEAQARPGDEQTLIVVRPSGCASACSHENTAMAKGAKKAKTPTGMAQAQIPNHWVKVMSADPNAKCTECSTSLGRGMRWIVGEVRACQRCGQRLARATRLAA